MPHTTKPPLIPARVLLIGDQQIPGDIIEGLSDECLQAFLRIPDPRLWPSGMEKLIEFLSEEERAQAYLGPIFARLAPMIGMSLREWARAAWVEFAAGPSMGRMDQGTFLEEAARFLTREIQAAISEMCDINR